MASHKRAEVVGLRQSSPMGAILCALPRMPIARAAGRLANCQGYKKGGKMKRMIPLALVVLSFIGCASTPPPMATTTEYSQIIVTDKSIQDTFDITMKWMAKYFVSPSSIIQYSDKNSGLITGKARTRVFENIMEYDDINYTLTIEIKDQKTRFTFIANNLIHKLIGNAYRESEMDITESMYQAFVPKVRSLIDSFTDYIKISSDW